METQKNQVVDRLNQATNILVTVSSNPSVDQLSGAIGLTLALNKLGKHATTVFSGAIPSTIDFLQPDKTIEKTTDSLRDFIISLDKSKADKLRYKVEDEMVKIFITPYLTPINEQDLEFSQGDFNVDVIVALGVREQQDLDQAITAHGRILHDATLIGVSTEASMALGSINWNDAAASSLSEMLTQLAIALKADILDAQMATALMTGIVAETNRFSNEKTSAETMQVSAKLMAAGANQQLVASQLQSTATEVNLQNNDASAEPAQINEPDKAESAAAELPPDGDGTLQIAHEELKSLGLNSEATTEDDDLPEIEVNSDGQDTDEELPSDQPGEESQPQEQEDEEPQNVSDNNVPESGSSNSGFITEPPSIGGPLADSEQKADLFDTPADSSGQPDRPAPMLSHGSPIKVDSEPKAEAEPEKDETVPLPEVQVDEQPSTTETAVADQPVPTPVEVPVASEATSPQTLADLERSLSSAPDLAPAAAYEPPPAQEPDNVIDVARDAVSQAMKGSQPHVIEPVQALNAQPMDLDLGDIPAVNTSPASAFADTPAVIQPEPQAALDSDIASDPDVPSSVTLGQSDESKNSGTPLNPGFNQTAPPPVPPPMMPPMPPPPGSDDPTVM